MKKKLLLLLTILTLLLALCFCASASYKEDRPTYPNQPDLKIIDGVVYHPHRVWDEETKTNRVVSYCVLDYFATNQLAKTATEINIVPEIDGVPVTAITPRYNSKTRNDTVTKLTIPDSVTQISHLFVFRALETIKLPENLEAVGDRCFANMDHLKEIDLPAKIKYIPINCFKNCKELQRVGFLGRGVGTIAHNAFYGCSSLENIDLYNVSTIQSGAFAYSGLRHVGFSEYIKLSTDTYYGNDKPIFYGCKRLETVEYWGDSPYHIHSSFYIPHDTFKNCTALKKVILPRCLHLTIGENAFMNCKALETVVNGEFIEFAPAGAFRNCARLKRIEIGNWADRIGIDTFKGCTGLKKLILKTDNVLLFDARYPRYNRNWNGNFLRGVPKTCRVYVPNDTMQQAVLSHGFTGKVIVKEMKDLATHIYDPV